MTRALEKLRFVLFGALMVLLAEVCLYRGVHPGLPYIYLTSRAVRYGIDRNDVGNNLNNDVSRDRIKVYRHNGQEFERLRDFCTWSVPLTCVTLKTPSGPTPIHIHDISVDIWVSGSLQKTGVWEQGNMEVVMSELRKDPNLGFLDLGSHVGAFSLTMAKIGRKVVSVDPLIENVQRLCKSAEKGGLADNMTIVFNPLADEHAMVNFNREANNVGGTSVVKNRKISKASPCDDSADSPTAMLDDLLPLLPFSKAVVKMDVQGYEFTILKSAKAFFKKVHVTAILMEWDVHKFSRDGWQLIQLLMGHGFKAYQPIVNGTELVIKEYAKWPYDVLWRQRR